MLNNQLLKFFPRFYPNYLVAQNILPRIKKTDSPIYPFLPCLFERCLSPLSRAKIILRKIFGEATAPHDSGNHSSHHNPLYRTKTTTKVINVLLAPGFMLLLYLALVGVSLVSASRMERARWFFRTLCECSLCLYSSVVEPYPH